ncbi:MAG: UDP-N-acetylmuramoyl-L-alanyl-D-glutamate--2,6-diaminopimelate ligase [Actinomycetes bacterium]
MGDLAALVGARLVGDPSALVTSVTHDSRRVVPGGLFCCVVGEHHDGHEFVEVAVGQGAAALLVSGVVPGAPVPQLVVDDVRPLLGPVAAAVLGHPSSRLSVVGVTGTNGKTTVVSLLGDVLTHCGRRAATIGTLTGERTTPEAPELQHRLAELAHDGVTDVAMEVSSHALVLGRVDAVDFAVGVFTNLGVDHLDFHGTVEEYFAAKARLFEPGRCRTAVVNVDDVHGRLLLDAAAPDGPEMVGVSVDAVEDLELGPAGSSFTWRDQQVRLPLPGRHNVSNALLVAETCVLLGVPPAQVAAGLGSVGVVPGRLELVDEGQPFVAAVDYAHTPDALRAVLTAAREMADGLLLVVFGCGGDRDRGKRPEMGRVVHELADVAILTTDNPRSEDPTDIAAEVVAGLPSGALVEQGGTFVQVPDRAMAIAEAVAAAGPGDVVVVAGKGHETTQVVGRTVSEFDDRQVLAAALRALGNDAARAEVPS